MSGRTAARAPWDRRLIRPLAGPLVAARVHPNAVTATGLACGLAAGALFAAGGSAVSWGAALFIAAMLLDHLDGEVARRGGRTSELGRLFDRASAGLGYAAVFAGAGWGLPAHALDGGGAALGALAGLSVLAVYGLRLVVAERMGETAIAARVVLGFEAEDTLYLVAPAAWLGALDLFVAAAAVGMPAYLGVQAVRAFRIRESAAVGSRLPRGGA